MFKIFFLRAILR